MTAILVAGLLAGLGIAVQVGAITVMIVTLSAQDSLRTGLAAGMGTATADGLYALVAATAGAGAAALLRPVAGPMRWTAAAVLGLIAARGIRGALRRSADSHDADDAAPAATRRPHRVYLQLLGLTILNPGTIVYFSVLVIGLRNTTTWSVTGSAVFVLAAFLASAVWQAGLAVGGSALGRVLTSEKGRLGSAIVGNTVIIALAVRLLVA